jgi:7,8-dihydropterin-6-yl-methyl-4-(beta-D-ribofuranosyl)aminobenzene 5'-phosphate synthase
MPSLQQLDKLVVDVLIDNQTDSYSSKPANVSPEFQNVANAGANELSGTTLCCAQLGLSLLLTGYAADGTVHKLLFDAGPEGAMFVRNSKNLGITLGEVEEVAITHGHWDHMGALTVALDEITGGGKRRVPCHVNPGMFLERGVKFADGRIVPFEVVPSPEVLSNHGAIVVNDYNERALLDNFFYLSGEIPRVTSFEKGRVDHMAREDEKQPWRSDPLLMDERYVAVNLRDRGVVVFSACSHAGIINVLRDARNIFGSTPIYCVFGGLHLVGSLEKIIAETVDNLKTFEPKQLVPAHCTGWRALVALVNAFGEQVVVPSQVGSRYTF